MTQEEQQQFQTSATQAVRLRQQQPQFSSPVYSYTPTRYPTSPRNATDALVHIQNKQRKF